MALQSLDLITPRGELNPDELWPGLAPESVDEKLKEFRLEGYLKAASLSAVEADQDAAVKQWVYYRAYSEVYRRLLVGPSTAQLADEGSRSYTSLQIQEVGVLADNALAAFEELLAAVVVVEVTTPVTRMSASVRTSFVF